MHERIDTPPTPAPPLSPALRLRLFRHPDSDWNRQQHQAEAAQAQVEGRLRALEGWRTRDPRAGTPVPGALPPRAGLALRSVAAHLALPGLGAWPRDWMHCDQWLSGDPRVAALSLVGARLSWQGPGAYLADEPGVTPDVSGAPAWLHLHAAPNLHRAAYHSMHDRPANPQDPTDDGERPGWLHEVTDSRTRLSIHLACRAAPRGGLEVGAGLEDAAMALGALMEWTSLAASAAENASELRFMLPRLPGPQDGPEDFMVELERDVKAQFRSPDPSLHVPAAHRQMTAELAAELRTLGRPLRSRRRAPEPEVTPRCWSGASDLLRAVAGTPQELAWLWGQGRLHFEAWPGADEGGPPAGHPDRAVAWQGGSPQAQQAFWREHGTELMWEVRETAVPEAGSGQPWGRWVLLRWNLPPPTGQSSRR